jgi:Na+-transporting methylmalonyl-CoA/oxaloacetate decarboxylase gamma subunit
LKYKQYFMNPEQPISINPREAKHLRTIITVGLVLLLVAILAAYIYYGMSLATKSAGTPEVPVAEVQMSPDAAEILKALEAAPAASPEDTEAVVKALETAPSASDAERQAILEALQ